MNPKRFTLRKEYFGGVLHDAMSMSCEVLTPDDFEFLRGLDAKRLPEEELGGRSQQLQDKARAWQQKGAIAVENGMVVLAGTRLIPKPDRIPEGCLTAPLRVYDTYTRKCNLRCKQCCVASSADFTEKRRTIRQTEAIMRKFYEAGMMEWRFTGGEPTSCPDLLDAIAIARGFGMSVMLNTNGCWDGNMLREIPEAGISEIIISVEGPEEINDKRRAPGVFRHIMEAIERIGQHNHDHPEQKVRITLNMTVAGDNANAVEFVVRLGARHGCNVNFVPLRPYGRTVTGLQKEMLSTKGFMEFSRNVQRLREDPEILASGIGIIHRNMDLFCPDYPDKRAEPYPFKYSACGALSTGFGLRPDGLVNACSFLMDEPDFQGPNMIEASVQEAWLHPKMERIRRAVKTGCTGCRFYMRQCEGKCTAMVLANGGRIEKGNLIGRDPYCFAPLMPGRR